jgi:hypothetical protein
MYSESGIKRRHVPVNDSKISNDSENRSDNEQNEDNNDEYDADSKETRLTLMEEILLLGLKDREVTLNLIYLILKLTKLALFRAILHFGMTVFLVV